MVEEKKECKTEVGPKILQPNPCKQEVNLEVNDDVLACEGLLMLHQSCKPKPQGVQSTLLENSTTRECSEKSIQVNLPNISSH